MDIEEEHVDEDVFQLLDCVTDLATLESELEDVKVRISRKSNGSSFIPLKIFRPSNCVTVSDIATAQWCEQQVEYRYLHPYMQSTQEWKRKREEGKIIKKRNQAMEAGSSIHYRREIEVHDVPIPVSTNTKEDKLAVDLINMYIKLAGVKEGNLGREVKVTGLPFNEGMVLVTGVIDQIQYCPAENSLIILELKTRTTFSLPSDEQKRGAALQLMLYKSLLDAWTQGMVDGRRMLLDMGLKLSQKLTLGVISYIYTMGLDGVLLNYGPVSIEELTHRIIELVVNMRLPMVDTLLVQYEYQKRGAIVGIESIIYDEEWAKKGLTNNLQYWLGVRAADGVDIEDSWKCQTCQYHDVCVKRKRQVAETSPVKKWPTNF